MKNKIKAFTIVELAVVMVVIGVLSAVAVPRIMNLYENSKRAATLGLLETFRSSLKSIRAQWIAEGQPQQVAIAGGNNYFWMEKLYPGHPDEVNGVVKLAGTIAFDPNAISTTDQDCMDIWKGVLGQDAPVVGNEGCTDDASCLYEALISGGSCIFGDKYGNAIWYDRYTGEVYIDNFNNYDNTTVPKGQNM